MKMFILCGILCAFLGFTITWYSAIGVVASYAGCGPSKEQRKRDRNFSLVLGAVGIVLCLTAVFLLFF